MPHCIGPYPTLAETIFFQNFHPKNLTKKKHWTPKKRVLPKFSQSISQNGEHLSPKYIY
jgi:hypothetical protein